MSNGQEFPPELTEQIDELLVGLADNSIAERDKAGRALATFLRNLWQQGDPGYRAVVDALKRRAAAAANEFRDGIASALGAAGIEFKYLKAEFLGDEVGDIYAVYSLNVTDGVRGVIRAVHVYFGGDSTNAYYGHASITPIDEPGFASWPGESWSGRQSAGQLILEGTEALGLGTYHFKIKVSNVKRPVGGARHEADLVATDRHNAPLLESRARVEIPFLSAP